LRLCTDQSLLSRIDIRHCDDQVDDGDKPSDAIRHKLDSSMGQAIQAVANGEASACISAGNTGALMALGRRSLKMLPGISRPAICSSFPTVKGRCYMLDLGANLDCSAEQLAQFAVLGALTASELDSLANPKVGLLNVGQEPGKGGQVITQTAELLSLDSAVNYCGYIEGDGIFQGLADVVVCDGFTGNVALKATEGAARMIGGMITDVLAKTWFTKLLMAAPLAALKAKLDPSQYNGAFLLGLNGVVVKSHGGADAESYSHALEVAIAAAKHNLPEVLSPILQAKLDKNER
jgi:glycerol-3-phosphate acyltransferase PlsX